MAASAVSDANFPPFVRKRPKSSTSSPESSVHSLRSAESSRDKTKEIVVLDNGLCLTAKSAKSSESEEGPVTLQTSTEGPSALLPPRHMYFKFSQSTPLPSRSTSSGNLDPRKFKSDSTLVASPEKPRAQSTRVHMMKCIQDPDQCFAFRDYLKEMFAEENLAFYFEVEKLKISDPQTIPATCLKIYDDYIKQSGHRAINIPGRMQKLIDKAIEEQSFDIDMFDAAQEEALRLLHTNSWQGFLESNQYKSLNLKSSNPKQLEKKTSISFVEFKGPKHEGGGEEFLSLSLGKASQRFASMMKNPTMAPPSYKSDFGDVDVVEEGEEEAGPRHLRNRSTSSPSILSPRETAPKKKASTSSLAKSSEKKSPTKRKSKHEVTKFPDIEGGL